ncbi:nucleolus protein [Diplocarpon rosae]|nr:nucleolus protein [Diplocarpon rosae]
MARKKATKLKSLSQGRPPTVNPPRSISSKATRNLIRTHHTLEKQKAKAIADGDQIKAAVIAKQIEIQGGIESYQRASLTGQTNERGGDSSKMLMEWLEPVYSVLKDRDTNGQPARLLEIGALSVSNACSRSRLFEVERIDLNSRAEGIKQQDFMERPIPLDDKEQFDVISLSLVLNYVPDPVGRGQMLLRTLKFLRTITPSDGLREYFPSLFLVLPSPCVANSRYLDDAKLHCIMKSLGFVQVNKKISHKLVYYLWRTGSVKPLRTISFKKEELRSGGSRNNFAIVLRGGQQL